MARAPTDRDPAHAKYDASMIAAFKKMPMPPGNTGGNRKMQITAHPE